MRTNVLHEGHKALLDRAMWMADELYIGITSDEMAASHRKEVIPYYLRRKSIEDYVISKGEIATIFPIDDIYGPPEIMDDIDILVVSDPYGYVQAEPAHKYAAHRTHSPPVPQSAPQ